MDDWEITCRISLSFGQVQLHRNQFSSLSHFNGCCLKNIDWLLLILWVLSHIIFELDCLSKARSRYTETEVTSFTHLHKRPKLDVLLTIFQRKASKAKAGKSATRHITSWKNCQYIHAKGQLFQANNLLGLQNSICTQNIYNRKLQTNRKIIHFECFCILQLKSLLIPWLSRLAFCIIRVSIFSAWQQ
jgi:hypothetical protein